MAPIGLQHESETGEVLSEYAGEVPFSLVEFAGPTSSCIRFIDPSGDAIFNQMQLPVLIAELKRFSDIHLGTDAGLGVEPVAKYLESCELLHTYVRFVGD